MADKVEFWRGLVNGFLTGVTVGVFLTALLERKEQDLTSPDSLETDQVNKISRRPRTSGAPSNVARFIAAEP